jgi:predicted  nucleic acid-binding Zn-ribbon protein
MSEVDFESQVSSEDEGQVSEKLVPVGEAIRYRKRAQSAEKQIAALEQELKTNREKNEQLAGELGEMKLEQRLLSSLTAAGVSDLEGAVLIAKARMKGSDSDVDSVVGQLRKEKSYLFEALGTETVASKTAGVKERKPGGQSVFERAAKRAATSGSRADVQEYMRVRRQFV